MNPIKHAINRPVAVTMFCLVVLFTGLAALSRLPLELVPEVEFPKLTVNTPWPDSSPETVEAFVTSPVEAVANTVTNVRNVESESAEGNSTVTIEFTRGTDMDFAALELSEKLSLVAENLPYGVSPPKIQKYVPREFQTEQFLSYSLTGNYSLPEIRRLALEQLRGPLLAIQGVADVQIYGGQEPEIRIEIDLARVRAFGLTEAQINQALGDVNIRMAAGKIYQQKIKYDVMIDEPVTDTRQIENLILASENGAIIRLKDVAVLSVGYAAPRNFFRINGNPAVAINIEKEIGINTIKVADVIFARLEILAQNLPPTLRLIKELDQSEQIRLELNNLGQRAIFSIFIIFLVLLAFLRNWVSPVIILSTIFFSVLLTFNLFYFARVGLNLITLAGLALGFGMLVDNSIIVLDNIYRYHQNGLDTVTAANRGATEIVLPVVACTLTTVAAFIPFLYLTGELRVYYLPFAIAVSLSLLSSLLVAFTFTPSLTFQFLEKRKSKIDSRKSPTRQNSETWGIVFNLYVRFLAVAIRYKFITIFLTLVLFATSFYLFNKYVTRGQIWSWGLDTYLVVSIRMPVGAEIARTNAIAQIFEQEILRHKHIDRVYTRVNSPENGNIRITFPPSIQFTALPLILKDRLTNLAVQIGGANVGVFGYGPGFSRGGGMAPSFQLQVLGYNYNQVKQIAEDVGTKLMRNARVRDVNTNSSFWWREDLYEMVLRLDREKLKRFNLTSQYVLNTVQRYLRESLGWQRIKISGKEIDYQVKMRGYRDFTIEDLTRLLIQTPGNETVRLNQVAYIGERKVLARILRKNQQYYRGVSFEYRGPYKLGDRFVDSIIKNTELPHGYKLERRTWFFWGEEEKRQIYWTIALAILLVYMVTAALFESFMHPFIVILTVPLALIGVFLIFYCTDTNFDRTAYIGVVLLAGIVVNNAIILVDHINLLRRTGRSRLEAVLQGARDRIRPILMTSATTILGLLPLVLFSKAETSIWYSLSLATIGGLLSSTLLVLVVIPVVYMAIQKGN